MINNKIKETVLQNKASMIELRRDLHRHPELPWEEFETTKRIAAELDKIGVEYRLTQPTGVIAEIKGAKPGKTVALRADIDALPVTELNNKIDYASTVPGKMHACGHDVHTAMLLTAAKAIHAIKDELQGNVRFIFQPAEEMADGALKMIEQGAIENVDNVFGMHVWSVVPTGKISCVVGSSFAAVDWIKINFKGRGGHGSMPHECIDAAVVASAFVMNVQSVISRESHPLQPAVFSIGKMDVGTRFNVIAENAALEGTVRSFTHEDRERIQAAIRRYAEHTAAMYGATVDIDYAYVTNPVINEERSAKLAQKVIQEAFGEDTLCFEDPTTGGEDFSYYTVDIPGTYALVGTRNPEKGSNFAHHHGCFNVDEDSLVTGAELYAQYAWNYLNQNEF
jgi:amidohydrolase